MAEGNGSRTVSLTLQALGLICTVLIAVGGAVWGLAWSIASAKSRPVIVADEASQALILALDGRYVRQDLASGEYQQLRREIEGLRADLSALRSEVRHASK